MRALVGGRGGVEVVGVRERRRAPATPRGVRAPVIAGPSGQRVSLWVVCLRSHLQYFSSSMRSRSLTLFFLVM